MNSPNLARWQAFMCPNIWRPIQVCLTRAGREYGGLPTLSGLSGAMNEIPAKPDTGAARIGGMIERKD